MKLEQYGAGLILEAFRERRALIISDFTKDTEVGQVLGSAVQLRGQV